MEIEGSGYFTLLAQQLHQTIRFDLRFQVLVAFDSYWQSCKVGISQKLAFRFKIYPYKMLLEVSDVFTVSLKF